MMKVKVEEKVEVGNTVKPEQIVAPEVLKSNQVFIEGYGVLTIKPTKLKYFESGKLNKEEGYVEPSMYQAMIAIPTSGYNTMLSYIGGKSMLIDGLKAVFDTDEIDFYDHLKTTDIIKIAQIANEVNEVVLDDFLLPKTKDEEERKEAKRRKKKE